MAPVARSEAVDEGDVTVLYIADPNLVKTPGTSLEREDDALTVVSETGLDGAVERLETGEIDCVVWRHGTPALDGLEALRVVRDRHDDLPFVLVTDESAEGIARLLFYGALENVLYRQWRTLVLWRGFLEFLWGAESWGAMERVGFDRPK